jgi:hypothetical protein
MHIALALDALIYILIFTCTLSFGFFSLFNATQRDADFALRASKAYQEIVDALQGARGAAINASIAADIAYKKVSILIFNCKFKSVVVLVFSAVHVGN